MVIEGRQQEFKCLWLYDPDAKNLEIFDDFPEPVYEVSIGINKEFCSSVVRVEYSSFITPDTTFEINLNTLKMSEIHIKDVPNYDKSHYVIEKRFAVAHDGKNIPMSIAFKKTLLDDEGSRMRDPRPLFLDGYGSYGICNDPGFSSFYVTLFEYGVIVVHAHIRGGSEMGRSWYEDEGKFLTKKNTFYDFLSCAQFLIDEKYTINTKLAIYGASAGGLLMGNVLNMAPHLFKCAVCDVPFVDLCTTMSDTSIPLTALEWEEWGNPNEEKYYEYMLSYDPYRNVTAQDYPAMLVMAGLHDPRVAYWEPAKWVARLRERKTDSNPLFLKTDLESGHFSSSDRFKFYREISSKYAFILNQIDAKRKLLIVE